MLRTVAALIALAAAFGAAPAHAAGVSPCKDADVRCGFVRVPLDRLDPAAGSLRIHYELHLRRNQKAPSRGTIVAHEGGPGYSTTSSRDSYLELYEPLMNNRDLLLVDARGTGRSGALDCPALQSYVGDYLANAKACGEQLGASADLYGSGQAAEDMVAVLNELGIWSIDLYGDSYGTFFSQTFAVRHPERLRSLVLDGAYPIDGLDPWYRDANRALVKALRIVCERAPTCPSDPAQTSQQVSDLAELLRAHPVTGTGYDADGAPVPLTVGVNELIDIAATADSSPTIYRELDPADRALRAGDPAPLLRLAAENLYFGDGGPVRDYSEASYLAVSCHDYPQLWDVGAGIPTRQAQYAAAEAALPADAFPPFVVHDWVHVPSNVFDACITWPAPTHPADPPLPAGASYPNVPTLVLNGDLDVRTSSEGARQVADAFGDSTFVETANVGHISALGDVHGGCAAAIVRRFVRTLDPGPTACAADYPPLHVPASFPLHAGDAAPASPLAGNAADATRLRTAAVGAATVADAVARWWNMYGDQGVGLRGGTFTVAGDPVVRMTLDGARLASDVAVSGRATWDRRTGAVSAQLRIEGPGAADGRLTARWASDAASAVATLTGTLGGQAVAASMPAP